MRIATTEAPGPQPERTGCPCQGRSRSVRLYSLWRDTAVLEQAGQHGGWAKRTLSAIPLSVCSTPSRTNCPGSGNDRRITSTVAFMLIGCFACTESATEPQFRGASALSRNLARLIYG